MNATAQAQAHSVFADHKAISALTHAAIMAAGQRTNKVNGQNKGAEAFSNWVDRAVEAFDENGIENFRDANGELIEGIYLNMPNDLYHSLPALSSSGLKKFKESPPHYYREYISDITTNRTIQQQRTFDAGTYGHELVLEPEGYYDRYFRMPLPIDFPNALRTDAEIKAELTKRGLKVSGSKGEKIARLLEADPTVPVLENLMEVACLKHGEEGKAVIEGREVVTYGGKVGLDGQVWDAAQRIAKSVKQEVMADAFIRNGLPEVAIIARCPVTGMMLKVKFDWLRFDDQAGDVKTTMSAMPDDFSRQMKKLSYDLQQAFYCYVAEMAGIRIRRFVFIAVEYQHADYCQLYCLSNKRKTRAEKKRDELLQEFAECKRLNVWNSRYSGSMIELD